MIPLLVLSGKPETRIWFIVYDTSSCDPQFAGQSINLHVYIVAWVFFMFLGNYMFVTVGAISRLCATYPSYPCCPKCRSVRKYSFHCSVKRISHQVLLCLSVLYIFILWQLTYIQCRVWLLFRVVMFFPDHSCWLISKIIAVLRWRDSWRMLIHNSFKFLCFVMHRNLTCGALKQNYVIHLHARDGWRPSDGTLQLQPWHGTLLTWK